MTSANAARPSHRTASNKLGVIREKRVLLSGDEERQIERLVDRIGEDFGTFLKLGHLLRACMTLLCQVEEELHSTETTLGPLSRTRNAPTEGRHPGVGSRRPA